ncbi:unnamed protein product [Pneumocystis jirovecii]|uniref:Large ribosomal subunit protein mL46 n=1 Tax=Pneumocystis jirovecii TaxID=42068 RepID=L0PEH3_PNEJI|nr:unnamed protein product [Pneumocystis jirovecii]
MRFPNLRFFSCFSRILEENDIEKMISYPIDELQPKIPRLYRILVATVLLRSPIISPEQTPFEKAYYAYQRQLSERLAAPFPVEFYFKKGSLAEKKWHENEAKRRKTGFFSDDVYDEAREEKERIALSRETEADRKGDLRSLERKLDKTLYLLVKKPREEHCWQFPQGLVTDDDVLHTAAKRSLSNICGNNMNIWYVGCTPIGNVQIFFMRARIMAGQVKLNSTVAVDWVWVTKDEIRQYVSKTYWNNIRAMLS